MGDYSLEIWCCILWFFSGVLARRKLRKVVGQKEWCSKGFQLPKRQRLGLSIQFYWRFKGSYMREYHKMLLTFLIYLWYMLRIRNQWSLFCMNQCSYRPEYSLAWYLYAIYWAYDSTTFLKRFDKIFSCIYLQVNFSSQSPYFCNLW